MDAIAEQKVIILAGEIQDLTEEELEAVVKRLAPADLETLHYLLQGEAESRDIIFLERR